MLTDDVHVGGLLAVTAPTLVFDNISFSGTGANTTFTGTVGITADRLRHRRLAVQRLDRRDLGTYTLAGEGADGGTMRLSVESLSLAVDGLGSLNAATVVLVSTKSGRRARGAARRDRRERLRRRRRASRGVGQQRDARVRLAAGRRRPAIRASRSCASGDVSLTGAGGRHAHGPGLERRSTTTSATSPASPVVVDTGAGNTTLDFAANVTSFSGVRDARPRRRSARSAAPSLITDDGTTSSGRGERRLRDRRRRLGGAPPDATRPGSFVFTERRRRGLGARQRRARGRATT